LRFHHDKHHAGYVTKLNGLVEGKPELEGKSLEELVRTQAGGIFNCAAQTINHEFYWNCMSPNGGGPAVGPVADAINKKWGSFEAFQEAFTQAAATHFGSGWAWLVQTADGVDVVGTHDAGNPLTEGKKPLLTCDVWEHAYYIDFRNDRAKYINTWWSTVNWEFVNAQLAH